MCVAVEYQNQDKIITPYFPNPYALLPVKQKNGEVQLLPWGRRESQAGNLPLGGWARLDSIQAGKWEKYFPKPVKIIVDKFAEKDTERKTHWINLRKDQFLQGLLARYDQEVRVYVVTIASDAAQHIHHRWPRIMTTLRFE